MGDSHDDYDDEDFEDFEGDHANPSPKNKRMFTPHSSKKSPAKNWDVDDNDYEQQQEDGDQDDTANDVEGQDLESYMKHYSGADGKEAGNNEDLSCERKPLEGVRPKKENRDEELLQKKLGYDFGSYSNQSSPQKGIVHFLAPMLSVLQRYL